MLEFYSTVLLLGSFMTVRLALAIVLMTVSGMVAIYLVLETE